MLQLDMDGHNPRNALVDTIGVVTGQTSDDLNVFLRKLITAYCSTKQRNRGVAGTSDHFSWILRGYKAVFPFEATQNPHIHTHDDTIDKLDFNYSKEFVKLAIGFLIEMSGDP